MSFISDMRGPAVRDLDLTVLRHLVAANANPGGPSEVGPVYQALNYRLVMDLGVCQALGTLPASYGRLTGKLPLIAAAIATRWIGESVCPSMLRMTQETLGLLEKSANPFSDAAIAAVLPRIMSGRFKLWAADLVLAATVRRLIAGNPPDAAADETRALTAMKLERQAETDRAFDAMIRRAQALSPNPWSVFLDYFGSDQDVVEEYRRVVPRWMKKT